MGSIPPKIKSASAALFFSRKGAFPSNISNMKIPRVQISTGKLCASRKSKDLFKNIKLFLLRLLHETNRYSALASRL